MCQNCAGPGITTISKSQMQVLPAMQPTEGLPSSPIQKLSKNPIAYEVQTRFGLGFKHKYAFSINFSSLTLPR